MHFFIQVKYAVKAKYFPGMKGEISKQEEEFFHLLFFWKHNFLSSIHSKVVMRKVKVDVR